MDQATSDRILGRDRGWLVDWSAAYRECARAMFQKARSVLRRWGLDSDLDEDAVHEAWLAILATEPSTIDNLEAFGVTVTWRKAIDLCRRSHHPPASCSVADEAVLGAEELYFLALDEMRLRDAVRGVVEDVLEPRERRIFVACQLQGRTRKAVAEQEGVTPQRVGQIVAAAARKLRGAVTSRLELGTGAS